MELKEYKKLYKIYSILPLPRELWDTPQHEEYMNAFHNDKKCQEWELKQRIKKAGIDYKNDKSTSRRNN
jgi:type II restriction/modification system DNA methylase subunit YeeA